MLKSITIFVISLLVAPALGLFTSIHGMNELMAAGGMTTIEEALAECRATGTYPSGGCSMFTTLHWLYEISIAALIVTLALPLVYLIAALSLGRSRDALARWFPPLVWVVMGILPLLMATHGILVWFASFELLQMRLIPSNSKLIIIIALLGGGLILAGFSILVSMRKLLAVEPLRVTGVVLEPRDMPELAARVKRLAQRLGSREPQRIVIGIEPTAYVANVPLRLRGVGDLPVAETLYLPATALRVLDDAELDALIGHELGHFRGADLEFSSRFAPAFRSMSLATESVSNEGGEQESTWLNVALLPALGFLSFMMYTLGRIVSRIGREREFEADKASLEVSSPRAVASLLVKFTVLAAQWDSFRAGVSALLHRGLARRNLSLDYLARTRQLIECDASELERFILQGHTPHPLDTHPTLEQRAMAAGVDAHSAMAPGLAALRENRSSPPGLAAIEERITQIDAEYYRHPACPLTLSGDPALPRELSYTRE